MGNRGSEAGARVCKGFAKPRGFGPGLASRVVRHVERDFGRFVVWHVEVEPTVPRFSPNYKTNAVHSVIIQLVDVPPSSPAITVVATIVRSSLQTCPRLFTNCPFSPQAGRSVWLRLQSRTNDYYFVPVIRYHSSLSTSKFLSWSVAVHQPEKTTRRLREL